MAGISPSAHLTTGRNETVKQHIAYDVSNRMETIYEARSDAEHGDPCLVTQYQYDGGSSRVSGMKEYHGTWDATWDF